LISSIFYPLTGVYTRRSFLRYDSDKGEWCDISALFCHSLQKELSYFNCSYGITGVMLILLRLKQCIKKITKIADIIFTERTMHNLWINFPETGKEIIEKPQ